MDYRKLDAALAAALEEVEDPEEPALAVFIHTAHTLSTMETNYLEGLGISGIGRKRQVFTATL